MTSPEIGSLFGACVAHAIDQLWRAFDEPDPFLVVEAGAGNGRLAREVLRAEPACASALRYVLVERSAALRAEQRARLALEPPDEALGPFVQARGRRPRGARARGGAGLRRARRAARARRRDDVVVLANELLDNLPFGIAEWDGDRWLEVRVGHRRRRVRRGARAGRARRAVRVSRPAHACPIPRGLREWCDACDALVERGFVLVVDYMMRADELETRPWLRTYRAHGVGTDAARRAGRRKTSPPTSSSNSSSSRRARRSACRGITGASGSTRSASKSS